MTTQCISSRSVVQSTLRMYSIAFAENGISGFMLIFCIDLRPRHSIKYAMEDMPLEYVGQHYEELGGGGWGRAIEI